jgi:large subunit ribosomal protein L23
MNIREILVRSIVTDKASSDNAYDTNTYVFEVGLKATKAEIKAAVEAYFGVTVEGVRTLIVRGKEKRRGAIVGKRSNWKKAYIRLADGDSIDIYGVVDHGNA